MAATNAAGIPWLGSWLAYMSHSGRFAEKKSLLASARNRLKIPWLSSGVEGTKRDSVH